MIKRLLQEDERILKATKRNQEIHMRFVEEAKRGASYEGSKSPQRFPHGFNQGYYYKE